MSADVQVPDEAIALQSVNSGSERERGPILRRGKLHLGQIVDEEVEFCGNTAQTGLDQPAQVREGGRRVRDQPACYFCSFPSVHFFLFMINI